MKVRFRVYGLDGHSQKQSFSSTTGFRVFRSGIKLTVVVLNSDITHTNDYTEIVMLSDVDNLSVCFDELMSQIEDGIFECCRTGKIEIYLDKWRTIDDKYFISLLNRACDA